jgi:hypothetical protein
VKAGYFPAVILKNDRKKYYDLLERAHRGNVNDFVILVARALERTLNLYFEAIPDLASNFLTLAEAAEESPYSKEYLNVLARRGGIPAFKIKRNWLVSRQALQDYVASPHFSPAICCKAGKHCRKNKRHASSSESSASNLPRVFLSAR